MKTAKEILIQEMASRLNESYDKTERDFEEAYKEDPDAKVFIDAMEMYALQCCEDLRERIAENAMTRTNDESTSIIVDKESILNTEIILP